jgi:membrane protease YdiL (CAAX protease family)
VAGLIIGFVARKLDNLPLGLAIGLGVGALMALPFALGTNPTTGKVYFWEILIPGALVGLIVGYATQRYGRRPATPVGAR